MCCEWETWARIKTWNPQPDVHMTIQRGLLMAHVKHNLKISHTLRLTNALWVYQNSVKTCSPCYLSTVQFAGHFIWINCRDTNNDHTLRLSSQSRQILWLVLKLLNCNWAQDAQENQSQLWTDLRFYSCYSILLRFFFLPLARQTPQNRPSVIGSRHLNTDSNSSSWGFFQRHGNI